MSCHLVIILAYRKQHHMIADGVLVTDFPLTGSQYELNILGLGRKHSSFIIIFLNDSLTHAFPAFTPPSPPPYNQTPFTSLTMHTEFVEPKKLI
jgi:hypothetical protein